jgi:hypothetical protein
VLGHLKILQITLAAAIIKVSTAFNNVLTDSFSKFSEVIDVKMTSKRPNIWSTVFFALEELPLVAACYLDSETPINMLILTPLIRVSTVAATVHVISTPDMEQVKCKQPFCLTLIEILKRSQFGIHQ